MRCRLAQADIDTSDRCRSRRRAEVVEARDRRRRSRSADPVGATRASRASPRHRRPRVRQAGSSTRLPSVLPAVAMPTIVPKLTNGSNSLARSAAKPIATARLERITPGPLTR